MKEQKQKEEMLKKTITAMLDRLNYKQLKVVYERVQLFLMK